MIFHRLMLHRWVGTKCSDWMPLDSLPLLFGVTVVHCWNSVVTPFHTAASCSANRSPSSPGAFASSRSITVKGTDVASAAAFKYTSVDDWRACDEALPPHQAGGGHARSCRLRVPYFPHTYFSLLSVIMRVLFSARVCFC